MPTPRPPNRRVAAGADSKKVSLIEVLIGLAVIAALITLLLPSMSKARARARVVGCINSLQQLGMALRVANQTRPAAVRSAAWMDSLLPYLENEATLLHCPADLERKGPTSYGMNHRVHQMHGGDGRKIVTLDYNKTEVIAVVKRRELQDDWPTTSAPRHAGNVNVMRFDGSVESTDPDAIDPRYCRHFDNHWRPYRDFSIALTDCVGRVVP